jgi:hypothetical protein
MTRLFLALVFVPALGLQAPPASVAGQWTVTANIGGSTTTITCAFTQKEAALEGTCSLDQAAFTLTGKVDGKTVTWQYNTSWEGQPLTAAYRGTLESPEKMVGAVDVTPMGVSGDFTAVKAK